MSALPGRDAPLSSLSFGGKGTKLRLVHVARNMTNDSSTRVVDGKASDGRFATALIFVVLVITLLAIGQWVIERVAAKEILVRQLDPPQ